MKEFLIFEVAVPIDTPDINHSSKPYADTVEFRKEEAAKVLEENLPNEWEFSFVVKIPQ